MLRQAVQRVNVVCCTFSPPRTARRAPERSSHPFPPDQGAIINPRRKRRTLPLFLPSRRNHRHFLAFPAPGALAPRQGSGHFGSSGSGRGRGKQIVRVLEEQRCRGRRRRHFSRGHEFRSGGSGGIEELDCEVGEIATWNADSAATRHT